MTSFAIIFFILAAFFYFSFGKPSFLANRNAQKKLDQGRYKFYENDYPTAISLLTEALEWKPQNPSISMIAYLYRSLSYYELENFNLAFEDVTKSLEIFPENPHARKLKGDILVVLQHYQKACDEYSHAIILEDDNPSFYYSISQLFYLHLKDYNLAQINIEKAIELNPAVSKYHELASQIHNALSNQEKDKK